MTFNVARLVRLIEEASNNETILVHQDSLISIVNEIEKETDLNIFLTTSDLRYTKGKQDSIPESFDCVIYIVDSHEAQSKTIQIINKYISSSNVILVGEKKSVKQLLKLFTSTKKFYQNGFLVSFLPMQELIEFSDENVTFSENIKGVDFTFHTNKGIFSYRSIDKGTQFLLDNIPLQPEKKVLDFACGYGVIGIVIKKICPTCDVVMIDSSFEATKCAKLNIRENKVSEIRIENNYLLGDITEKFDIIVSNPPTHMNLGEADMLMKQFRSILSKNGEVYIVINRIVNYERFAKEYFKKIDIIAENNQYKILKLC